MREKRDESLGLPPGLPTLFHPMLCTKDHLIRIQGKKKNAFSFLFTFSDILTLKVIISGANSSY